ncbi:MAG: T9SS type A sorting domain-containing protein [Bacteroidetes bacterium]|nr:T9SS type A sorting domain-containing protein [Bacteroidota bacterium]MBL6943488.1 T9SS type A sorting domain-containing protein [Bacteroidales bacterium]
MKKILLSIAVIILTVFYANAQSFTLSWDGELLGDTITISPDSSSVSILEFGVVLNNNTTNGVNIKVVRNQISLLDSTINYYCWGVCYPSHIDSSGMYKFVPAGGSSEVEWFSAHYEIHDAVGISLVEYKFYNMDNPDEYVTIVAKFDTSPDGIEETILNNTYVSEIYPNPAINTVNIDYDLPREVEKASVKIINLLGSVVKEQEVDTRNSKMRMDVSDLNGGIYFYSLFINGEIYSTKKLIVR